MREEATYIQKASSVEDIMEKEKGEESSNLTHGKVKENRERKMK